MKLSDYERHVGAISFGKRLPGAVYVYRDGKCSLGGELDRLIETLVSAFNVDNAFNVIKFRLDELKVSFLSYPSFLDEPHPALRQALTIDLVRWKTRLTDYAENPNPPILHRKETFLPHDHPKRGPFAALTEAEEAAGLFSETATIGFKLNWERHLASKGIAIVDNVLRVTTAPGDSVVGAESLTVPVDRHKTALIRYDLSKPVRTLLEYGQLRIGESFFDYGCGQGADVNGLRSLGYNAEGFDPVHRPNVGKAEADVINLGYVINVIEDPAERLETLVDAFRYARKLLVVSGLICETVDTGGAQKFHDGVLTKRNTFQKYFEQHELQQYVEDALDRTAVPVALGVFYVFRDTSDQQDFLAARTRRGIDWTQVRSSLGLGQPRKPRREAVYERHQELLQGFWEITLRLGRLPAPHEFDRSADLRQALGSPKRAFRLLLERDGLELFNRATEARRNDLLVYLALANLRRRVAFGHLSPSLRLDIRTFFGNYKAALEKGLDLLFAAGDPGEIEVACEGLKIG